MLKLRYSDVLHLHRTVIRSWQDYNFPSSFTYSILSLFHGYHPRKMLNLRPYDAADFTIPTKKLFRKHCWFNLSIVDSIREDGFLRNCFRYMAIIQIWMRLSLPVNHILQHTVLLSNCGLDQKEYCSVSMPILFF